MYRHHCNTFPIYMCLKQCKVFSCSFLITFKHPPYVEFLQILGCMSFQAILQKIYFLIIIKHPPKVEFLQIQAPGDRKKRTYITDPAYCVNTKQTRYIMVLFWKLAGVISIGQIPVQAACCFVLVSCKYSLSKFTSVQGASSYNFDI